MIEPRTGVFVGVVSALVRDKLWEKVTSSAPRGSGAVMLHTALTEQRFRVRTWGDPSRDPVDLEGLTLVRIPRKSAAEDKEPRRSPDTLRSPVNDQE